MSPLELVPCTLVEAHEYVRQHHRHLKPAQGALFAVACAADGVVRGVAVVGRPLARMLRDGWTAEIVRCATDGARNACSLLYAAAWRACRALGYRRLVTYTLPSEGGASLRGAGWSLVAQTRGGSWSRRARPRVDRHPTQAKFRWEVVAP
ncbi:MAG TPA: XF1762 family protein [Polyangiaceae bacterium]|nr:XF1762 family protein [Polyangiaceae bacterium]